MSIWKVLAFLGICALLAAGCSQKKEEAARLEKEMMHEEAGAVDTTAGASLAPGDTAERAATGMDVSAIPQEEEPEFVPQQEAGGYVVQVAACESLEYARYLMDKYTARGYSPYLTTVTVEGQTYYRVRIGGFETQQQASELQAELVNKYSVKAWIDKTD